MGAEVVGHTCVALAFVEGGQMGVYTSDVRLMRGRGSVSAFAGGEVYQKSVVWMVYIS